MDKRYEDITAYRLQRLVNIIVLRQELEDINILLIFVDLQSTIYIL
jgi:hypothetical protein